MTIDVCTASEGHGRDGTVSFRVQKQLAAQGGGAGGVPDGLLGTRNNRSENLKSQSEFYLFLKS